MSPRLDEGDPILPVPEFSSKGLHERDVFIAAALASATGAWLFKPDGTDFMLSAEDVADRACRIAAATMERKERAP